MCIEMVSAASEASDLDVWVSIDAYFHGGFNETISGRV
jgi:hypothetical protein